ncbi:hypothetical protein QEH59_12570 [Coraliomargarita sp. SDUM461004]|uniref:Cell division protein CrgA n=1 Tax=Thalassobacterium sedimentorum TaxID=3041258 RepID=A0ABU1AN34_9BACT|nr:hypothetical protein [Coraliomargarita sp. SDUM461004]MDQ8195265.1 hypothetical protein [Coraliomargarita sp. SDUM461004]
MSRKRRSRAAKAKRKEEARIAKIKNQRVKEKPQRRQTAICFILISLLFIGLPLIVVVASQKSGGHIQLPVVWLVFDALFLSATLWVIYDWLK